MIYTNIYFNDDTALRNCNEIVIKEMGEEFAKWVCVVTISCGNIEDDAEYEKFRKMENNIISTLVEHGICFEYEYYTDLDSSIVRD